jgi:natural product biosynthesis luciferase-like monooxygenase protein
MSDAEKALDSSSREQRSTPDKRLKQGISHTTKQRGDTSDHEISESLKKEGMQFSLIFFSGDGSTNGLDKYRLLLESAKFADRNGFSAVWTPERHFQPVGGLYPNPSVLGAALATITNQIQLRAGSVVLPLHHPLRVAEEWSIVDNLSGGRAAISVATGWHPADFVLNPSAYENRKEIMFENLELIRRLWRGEPAHYHDVKGNDVEVNALPRPIQAELPIFLTTSGNPATWMKAGELGLNVLCSLANHTAEALKERIQLYRATRLEHGHAPETGIVSVMLHTFVGENDREVKEIVRAPLRSYLNTFLGQFETLNPYKEDNKQVRDVLDKDKEALITFAFEKYFNMSALMGSQRKCAVMIERLHALGVNEVACLLDFGLEFDQIMGGLEKLNELRKCFVPQGQVAV